ncbi:MAG: response regulator [Gammaproteobacteria bacterium]|nr:response regulator [Gammaproteobacteria bacterium]
MKISDKSTPAEIYREEYIVLEKTKEILDNRNLSQEALWGEYALLSREYKKLLRATGKIINISDKAQRKLMSANARIQQHQEEFAEKNTQLQREIVERKLVEEQVQRRNQELLLVNRIGQMFNSTLELEQVLENVLSEMHHQLSMLATSFWLCVPDTGELICKQSVGSGQEDVTGWRLASGQGIVGQAAQSGKTIVIADTRTEARHYKKLDMKTGVEVRSILNIPFRVKGKVIGVLSMVDTQVNRFTENELRLIEPIVAAAASAVENARLYMLARQEIAERKRTEEKLLDAKEAAEAANQAKSTFLANMGHELRTPLTAIIGFSQLMERGEKLSPEYLENVLIIRRSGEYLLALINDILDLSKVEAGRLILSKSCFDLYQMLDDIEDMFRLRAKEKRLQLIFKRIAEVPQYVRTDETRLRQVLLNLLSNAVKFTAEGGVTLRAMTKDASETAEAPTVNLWFEVEDTGPGIAPEEQGYIFDAFVQTQTGRETREGTGLGLAISRKFVQLMGGDITVKSEAGKGTIFVFDIQAEAAETADVKDIHSCRRIIALEPGQPHYRILVVDDKWTNRQLLLKLLIPLGFEVREASDGQEAIDVWEEFSPHLIWMDMRMPGMDGHEATRRIKATTKGQATAVIALTASILEDGKTVMLSSGCDDFVLKPFRQSAIFDTMAKHVGVRYICEENEEPQAETGKRSEEDALTSSALATLPPDLLTTLEDAITRVNMDLIAGTIEDIHTHNAALANTLKQLIDNFEYHNLLSLIQETRT